MNNYSKLLADLANMDGVTKNEDKALILLNSLPDEEHETFVLSLINGKASLSYNDVSAALMNHEVRKKDKKSSSSSTTAEVLTARGMSSNHRKGKGDVGKSMTGNHKLRKNQCAFCKKKNIGRLIVQGSRMKRDRNQKQISHSQMMVLIQTLQCFHFLSPYCLLLRGI